MFSMYCQVVYFLIHCQFSLFSHSSYMAKFILGCMALGVHHLVSEGTKGNVRQRALY
jgi:hypothetical protein